MAVQERLKLAIRPTMLHKKRISKRRHDDQHKPRSGNSRIKDPILHALVRRLGRLLGLMPSRLDLLNEPVFVRFPLLVDLDTGPAEIALEPRGIPAIVGVDDIIVPIFVDNPLEVLAVGRL